MTPPEILIRLDRIPSCQPLTAAHVAGLADVLLSVPQADSLAGRPLTESDLADMLGESQSTLESWHILGDGGHIRYRAGDVRDWLYRRATWPGLQAKREQFEIDGETYEWGDPLLAVIIDGWIKDFWGSLGEMEMEPGGYEVLRIATPAISAYSATALTRDQFDSLHGVLDALNDFANTVQKSPDEAQAIYDKWKTAATPDALLLFLRSSLGSASGIAEQIMEEMPDDIRQRVNPARWLYELWLAHGLERLDLGSLKAILIDRGDDLNMNAFVERADGTVVFHGTVSHLLADTDGRIFHLVPPDASCRNSYDDLLYSLLENGLAVDRPNRDRLTARKIGEQVRGGERPWFRRVLSRFELETKLNRELPVNEEASNESFKKPVKL
ncbi:hypothetical protein [Burkholderia sp. Cy-637]|uniref:hypothetical protein n=1 Tax=Burkholderia sp. Cy-637 TaxID=2608327 RepID=UPI00141F3AD5|nr:hypothetical protein [Burkholderia sp. Cy-637]NIF86881.1 hypothetical protein [Burkholderia sp. Cy-637]